MKKLVLVVMLAVAGIAFAAAQPRAIGVNLGSGLGFSYQHGFGDANMLDVAVHVPLFGHDGTWCNGIGAHITYDWVDPFGTSVPWNQRGEWHWAMGVGGAGGIYGWHAEHWYVGVAGHIGIAYDFWFPMELSVDWRPCIGVDTWGPNDNVRFGIDGLWGNIGIGLRYKF